MRFLADENFKRRVVVRLARAGHDVAFTPKGLKDKAVADLAKAQQRVLLTHDHDFANSQAFPPAELPGIVLLAVQPPTLERIVAALDNVLSEVPAESFSGKLIVVCEVDSFEISQPAAKSTATARARRLAEVISWPCPLAPTRTRVLDESA